MKPVAVARAGLGVLLLVSAGLWVGALASSSRPPVPALLVYGEPVGLRGATWPVRVVAVWPSERRTALVDGALVVGDQRAPLERGVGRVTLPSTGDEASVHIEGDAGGTPVRLSVDVQLARLLPVGRAPRHVPWTREVAPGGAPATSGPPLYPVTGRVPASVPTEVVVLRDGDLERVPAAPNAAGVAMPDGRVLHPDRSVVVVEAPVAARPGAGIEVALAYGFAVERVHVDLVVNGLVRDLRVLEGGPPSVALELPDDAREGWFAVRASPSPLPAIPSDHALGLLLDDGDPADPATVVRALSRQPAFRDGRDPLLRHLAEAPPSDLTPVRALLGRLRADDARAPNLAPPARDQAARDEAARVSAVARYRVPFRISGSLFALLAAAVALSSARAAGRWQEQLHGDDDAPQGRRLPSLGWALLALASSLSALWVLDWAIGLMLAAPAG